MELNQYEEKMKKSLANLEEEYGAIRAGRANPRILDRIQVDYYGTPTSLQGVANISVPEARMIQIQPWDAGKRWKSDSSGISGTYGGTS